MNFLGFQTVEIVDAHYFEFHCLSWQLSLILVVLDLPFYTSSIMIYERKKILSGITLMTTVAVLQIYKFTVWLFQTH